MLFGLGGGNRKWRYVRLGLLAGVIILGVISGHSKVYQDVRLVYFVIVIGMLVISVRNRGTRPMGQRANQPIETRAYPTGGTQGQQTQPGWYPDPSEGSLQRYWDGSSWGAKRRWNGSAWVTD